MFMWLKELVAEIDVKCGIIIQEFWIRHLSWISIVSTYVARPPPLVKSAERGARLMNWIFEMDWST